MSLQNSIKFVRNLVGSLFFSYLIFLPVPNRKQMPLDSPAVEVVLSITPGGNEALTKKEFFCQMMICCFPDCSERVDY